MRAASWAWVRSSPSSTNCLYRGGRRTAPLKDPQRDGGRKGLGTARSPSLWRRSAWWGDYNQILSVFHRNINNKKRQKYMKPVSHPCSLSPAAERPRTASCLLFVRSSVRQTAGLVCQPQTQRGTTFPAETWQWPRACGARQPDPAGPERNPEEEQLRRSRVEQDGCTVQPRTEWWRLCGRGGTREGGEHGAAGYSRTAEEREARGGRLADRSSLEAEGSNQEGNHRLYTDKSLVRAGRSSGGQEQLDEATGTAGCCCGEQLRCCWETSVSVWLNWLIH